MSCLPAEGAGKQLDRGSEPPPPPENPTLESLRLELGATAVERFVAHYLSLLDERLVTIDASIRERRVDSGITVLLTLETSSHMVGATDLCGRALALRLALDRSEPNTADLYAELVDAARSARRLLAAS